MIDNLTRERESIEADLIEGYTEKNRKDKELSEIDGKITASRLSSTMLLRS